jgi:hypothetical protein
MLLQVIVPTAAGEATTTEKESQWEAATIASLEIAASTTEPSTGNDQRCNYSSKLSLLSIIWFQLRGLGHPFTPIGRNETPSLYTIPHICSHVAQRINRGHSRINRGHIRKRTV